jgi:hypothetical protein
MDPTFTRHVSSEYERFGIAHGPAILMREVKMKSVEQDVKERIRALRDVRESIGKDPAKARQWLAQVGVVKKPVPKTPRRHPPP